jgi:hypothetical protein
MTTPSGLPQKGDRLRYVAPDATWKDREFIVVERRGGTSLSYSVVLRSADGKPVPSTYGPPTRPNGVRYPPDHMLLLEAGYWIGRTYQYVTGPPATPTSDRCS